MKTGKKQMSSRARFVFGAGIGIAVSVALFNDIDSAPVKFLLMTAFAGIMGYAQVFAGRESDAARKFTKLAITGGILALAIGIIAFLVVE